MAPAAEQGRRELQVKIEATGVFEVPHLRTDAEPCGRKDLDPHNTSLVVKANKLAQLVADVAG